MAVRSQRDTPTVRGCLCHFTASQHTRTHQHPVSLPVLLYSSSSCQKGKFILQCCTRGPSSIWQLRNWNADYLFCQWEELERKRKRNKRLDGSHWVIVTHLYKKKSPSKSIERPLVIPSLTLNGGLQTVLNTDDALLLFCPQGNCCCDLLRLPSVLLKS